MESKDLDLGGLLECIAEEFLDNPVVQLGLLYQLFYKGAKIVMEIKIPLYDE